MPRQFEPTTFGRYQLTERIAVGGMAEIFAAKVHGAMGFEKSLVIKRILPQFAVDAAFLRMFVTEAKLVCHLEHPNIVQVHELGEIDGQYYIAMEQVSGIDGRQLWRTLAKRKQRLPGVLALFLVAEFLKGLDYAHRAVGADGKLLGVVHRDVSPSNILISFRGDVKIGDFGIALVQQESKTQAGVLKGKFGYMSPEQVAGITVDHRSDLFAAGIVLAELLLGRRLFLGASDFETLDKVMNVRLDVLEEHEAALPPEAVRILRRALQRDVTKRYQSARDFQDDIAEYLYHEGHRITSETLAAFMAEHVVPHLSDDPGRKRPSSPSEPIQLAGANISSPVVNANVVSVDLDLGGGSSQELPEHSAADDGAPYAELGPDAQATASVPPVADAPPALAAGGPGNQAGLSSSELQPIEGFVHDSGELAATDDEGAGEELDLDLWDDEEEPVYIPPPQEVDRLDQAHGLVEKQLDQAELERAEHEQPREPDFKGSLASRTVAKVLFRFAVVQENGLMVFTGPPHSGEQGELMEWLFELQAKVGASSTTERSPERTCEIHLLAGEPHLASADRSEEALIAHLIRTEEVTRSRVEQAIRQNAHRRPVAALLAAGALAPLMVSRFVVSFVLQSVFESFSWREGSFAFYRDWSASSDSFPTGLQATELLLNGAGHLDQQFLQHYFGGMTGHNLVANRTPPARIEHFGSDETMLQVYQSLGEPQPVERAVATCQAMDDPLVAMQMLYLLLECELATLV